MRRLGRNIKRIIGIGLLLIAGASQAADTLYQYVSDVILEADPYRLAIILSPDYAYPECDNAFYVQDGAMGVDVAASDDFIKQIFSLGMEAYADEKYAQINYTVVGTECFVNSIVLQE